MALIITDKMVKRKEFVLEGHVFRRVTGFQKYHISDRGTVVSTAQKTPKELSNKYCTVMSMGGGYMRRMRNVDICAMTFK